MFGIDDAIIGGIAAPIIGGLIGGGASAGDRELSIEQRKKALEEWLSINVPDPEQQKIILQRYSETGQLAPEIEQAINQKGSELSKIQLDPQTKEKQLRALSSLEDLGYSGGLGFEDRADLQSANSEAATRERGERGALMDRMERRGVGGTGMEMAAALSGQQAAANRYSQNSLNAVAMRKKRALEAIMGAGDLAGKMEDREYGQKSATARAEDAINEFNTRNMQSVQSRNIASRNAAAAENLRRRQHVADSNVDMGNKEHTYNKGLIQQQFDNQARLASGKANAYNGVADASAANADRTANTWAGIGSGIGSGLSRIGAANMAKRTQGPGSMNWAGNGYGDDEDYFSSLA